MKKEIRELIFAINALEAHNRNESYVLSACEDLYSRVERKAHELLESQNLDKFPAQILIDDREIMLYPNGGSALRKAYSEGDKEKPKTIVALDAERIGVYTYVDWAHYTVISPTYHFEFPETDFGYELLESTIEAFKTFNTTVKESQPKNMWKSEKEELKSTLMPQSQEPPMEFMIDISSYHKTKKYEAEKVMWNLRQFAMDRDTLSLIAKTLKDIANVNPSVMPLVISIEDQIHIYDSPF